MKAFEVEQSRTKPKNTLICRAHESFRLKEQFGSEVRHIPNVHAVSKTVSE